MRLTPTLVYAAAVALAACSGDSLTAPAPPDHARSAGTVTLDARAASSGCYTLHVTEHSEQEPFGGAGAGTLGGDLEGNVDVQIVALRFTHGAVVFNEVEATWEITGGVVPELVGKEIVLLNRGEVVHMPDNDPAVLRMNGRLRAVSGVERANLTSHATFDTRGDPWVIESVYQGVICP